MALGASGDGIDELLSAVDAELVGFVDGCAAPRACGLAPLGPGAGGSSEFGEELVGGRASSLGAGVAGSEDFVEVCGYSRSDLSGEIAALGSDAGEQFEKDDCGGVEV